MVDSYFTLEECERVLSKLHFTLKGVKYGYRYYSGMDGRSIQLRNSKQIPTYYVQAYLCPRLGLELWTFSILAAEGP